MNSSFYLILINKHILCLEITNFFLFNNLLFIILEYIFFFFELRYKNQEIILNIMNAQKPLHCISIN